MTETTQQAPAVYAAACESYRQAGWQGVIPVPPDRKFPPPEGFTGADGRYPEPGDITGMGCLGARALGRAADAGRRHRHRR